MKYYYTDALAAAWQAKHHGMALKSKRGQNLHYDGGSDFRTEKDCGVYGGEYYYIHPDSLPLLEPQEGDVGYEDERAGIFSEKRWTGEPDNMFWQASDEYGFAMSKATKIIQRNGKAFMWPEKEGE